MTEKWRSRRMWPLRVAGPVAAAVVAAFVLAIPATATAATARPAQPAVVARGAIVVGAGSGARVAAATGTTTGKDSTSVAQVTEGRRANGVLGQWVVAVLLGVVIALWVTLVAVVVRMRMRFARSPGRGPATT